MSVAVHVVVAGVTGNGYSQKSGKQGKWNKHVLALQNSLCAYVVSVERVLAELCICKVATATIINVTQTKLITTRLLNKTWTINYT
jgi:hypothetical protein